MSDDVNNGINSGIALQYLNYIEPYVREIEGQRREIASLEDELAAQVVQVLAYKVLVSELDEEIASLKELIIQAIPYVEYAVKYSTPLSQKLSEDWLEKTQERREK